MSSVQDHLPTHNGFRTAQGYAAIIFVVTLWASFAISVRAIHTVGLSAGDLALIRYGIPFLLLAPLMGREWKNLIRVTWRDKAMIAAGGGIPFFFLTSFGSLDVTATVVGSIVTGTLPLTVALVAWLIDRSSPRKSDVFPMLIILFGVATLVAPQALERPAVILEAVSVLLICGAMWAFYTLGLRRSRLSPIACAILLCGPSTLYLMSAWSAGLADISFQRLCSMEALPFILAQGVGAGLLAGLAYPLSIGRIGAARVAQIGSLTPVVTCIGGWVLLGEVPSLLTVAGVVTLTSGVVIINLRRHTPTQPLES